MPEAVAMWRLQIKRSRVRFPHWNFFFTPFFFCLIFPPFFFLHARSAISMLKHFSSLWTEVIMRTRQIITCIIYLLHQCFASQWMPLLSANNLVIVFNLLQWIRRSLCWFPGGFWLSSTQWLVPRRVRGYSSSMYSQSWTWRIFSTSSKWPVSCHSITTYSTHTTYSTYEASFLIL